MLFFLTKDEISFVCFPGEGTMSLSARARTHTHVHVVSTCYSQIWLTSRFWYQDASLQTTSGSLLRVMALTSGSADRLFGN